MDNFLKRYISNMKKTALKTIFCLASMATLSGCTFSSDALFPSLFGSDVQEGTTQTAPAKNSLPELGTTNFEPLEVSQGGNTGTLVGQKVITFRKELSQLQNAIRINNDELQKVRSSVISNALQYHKLIGSIEAKLQVGTTPGNPQVYAMLQGAQNNIQVMNANSITLNQISQRVSSDAAMTTYLLDSIKAAFLVSGAVDEDHRQLRILENETGQTSILIQSLLSEVNSDTARQQQYTETARNYIVDLDSAIKVGNFMGASLMSGNSAAPYGTPSQVFTNGSPLLVIKFNKSDVKYFDALKKAVSSAKAKNPNVGFDVVAVQSGKSITAGSQNNANNVFQEIIKMGVDTENVSLSATTDNSVASSEVHIFVK